jgi:hypothetical protein
MNEMSPRTKRAIGRRLWLAALLLTAGVAMAGLSLAKLQAQNRLQMAQATGTPGQPLQATPSPSPSTAPPAEAKPGGTRPTTPAPEPARPDSQAQTEGAVRPALPAAPAEKMAPPIKDK